MVNSEGNNVDDALGVHCEHAKGPRSKTAHLVGDRKVGANIGHECHFFLIFVRSDQLREVLLVNFVDTNLRKRSQRGRCIFLLC
jgi:hypothetical protein